MRKFFTAVLLILFTFGLNPLLHASEVKWKELNLLARDLFAKGDREAGIEKAKEALAYAQNELGTHHESVSKTLNNLGVLHFIMGQKEVARDYYQQALEVIEEGKGSDDPSLGDTLVNLAKLDFSDGNYSACVSGLERAVQIFEKNFGRESIRLAPLLEMLVHVYREMGLLSDAEATRQRLIRLVNNQRSN